MTEVKLEEARLAVRDGAHELDMVMNLSAFTDGMPWPKIELAKLSVFAHDNDVLLKVIIEVGLLNTSQIVKSAKLCADAGVDFVKTCTGYSAGGGVSVEHVKLLRETLPSSVGIKASGGIKSHEQVMDLVKAGADRIGTSKALQILK